MIFKFNFIGYSAEFKTLKILYSKFLKKLCNQISNHLACGVPLPWNLTNPWLFFDGKLFHLKLRMSVGLQNLREVCDDQLDLVMKIERIRKAILEDIENLVPFTETMYRPVYTGHNQYALYGSGNSKNVTLQQPISGSNNYPYNVQQMYYQQNVGQYALQTQRQAAAKAKIQPQPNARVSGAIGYQKNNGYQLKVGGVVVGSWATNRSQATRVNRSGMVKNKTIFFCFDR